MTFYKTQRRPLVTNTQTPIFLLANFEMSIRNSIFMLIQLGEKKIEEYTLTDDQGAGEREILYGS